MTRILLLGLDPETVDFSDPALPPPSGRSFLPAWRYAALMSRFEISINSSMASRAPAASWRHATIDTASSAQAAMAPSASSLARSAVAITPFG